LKKRKCEQ
jgi:hypothetical protein